ncbi:NADH-cytochrome b5 reductase [Mortierella polycephala]|uniref:NADH-cytochrome b5 reductase n=1 Tax=Mortierella polycephala TaxID=41804 RepID=A0A9P6PQH1_9FUNG|nr:NADH-cytochrome b5 reductase [Mortierella polycephala]
MSSAVSTAPTTTALVPTAFVDFKLQSVHALTPNTSKFVFELPEHQTLGMTVASCVVTKFTNAEGKNIIRPYTPTSDADQKGSFEFIVKRYDAGVMSAHFHSLKVGDTLAIKGPFTKYALEVNQYESVALIAGGTGITPMLQVIGEILKNKEDKTKINLLFANVTPEDIILKDVLDALTKAHPDQLKITYVIDNAVDGWEGETGFITGEMIKKHIPEIGSAGNKAFVCGPPPLMAAVSGEKNPDKSQGEIDGILKALGLTIEQVYKF